MHLLTVHQGQVIIRLKAVRSQIAGAFGSRRRSRSQLEKILLSIHSVTEAAAEADIAGFVLVCRHVSGRLKRMIEEDEILPALLARIGDWAEISELYVRRPNLRQFARMVVFQLNDPLWGLAINHNEQAELIDQLYDERRGPKIHMPALGPADRPRFG